MRTKKFVLPLVVITCCFATACQSKQAENSNSYILTFYQPDANHSDEMKVHIGQTKYEKIKEFANSLYDYTKVGYDRTWDWEHYDFENQKEDWTITAIPVLHNYRISFQYDGEEKGFTTYTINDSTYTVPEMHPTQKGYTYTYETVNIEGKHEDIVIDMGLTKINYELRFYLGLADPNPTVVTYNFDNPTVSVPAGPLGYVSSWETIDGGIQLKAETEINMLEVYGEDKLDNYSLFLNKTPKKYTVTFEVNGGTMTGETTKEVTFGEVVDFPIPTFKNGAKFLGWSDSQTGTLLNNGDEYSVPSNAILYARYGIDFENSESAKLITSESTRQCIESKLLDNTTKTEGNQSLKITTKASTTFSCSLDSELLASAFADPSVVAINFDCKTSSACTYFSYANAVNAPYEHDCINQGNATYFGSQTYWKTFSLTREMYGKKPAASGDNIYDIFWTVGGQLPVGSYIWFDNIRPVSEQLTPWGFENSGMVEYQPESAWYSRVISYRNFDNKEIFTYTPTSECDSKFGYSYDIKSEGMRSITAHKNNNKNVSVSVLNCGEVKSVTFDVYVTTELNTSVTFITGNQKPISDTNLKAYTWTTFTVPVEKMNVDQKVGLYSFLWLCGSPDYDIYFDNIRVNTL